MSGDRTPAPLSISRRPSQDGGFVLPHREILPGASIVLAPRMRGMKAARRSVAVVSGILLYCTAIGAAMSWANTGLPRHVYTALGGRNSLPVMLGEALATALVVFVLSALWGYLTLRPSRRRHRPYVAWMMAGIGAAWAGWLIFGAFDFALKPRAYSAPLQTVVLSSNAAPLFGALNIFGVLGGVWLAGYFAKKRQLGLPTTRSLRREDDEEAEAEPAADTTVSTITPPAR